MAEDINAARIFPVMAEIPKPTTSDNRMETTGFSRLPYEIFRICSFLK